MRVLILHNRYRLQGGEERAVFEIAGLLERRGHTVEILERSSAHVTRGRAARALLTGGADIDRVERALHRLQADVVHAHNVHPMFGWRALAAARRHGARTVLHLHNFRLYCSIGIAYRDGAPCHQCRGHNTLPGVIHRCRGSLGESAVYAAGLAAQQSRLLAEADRLIVLSQAHGELLRRHGLPTERLSVVPNFAPVPAGPRGPAGPRVPAAVPPGPAAGPRVPAAAHKPSEASFAFVSGRLVEEKGFDTAIRAARAAGVPLVVAGQGPDEQRLRDLAQGGEVRFPGWLGPRELDAMRAGAALVLAPSRCEEACPYSVLEALAAGLPVLVSDRGGLPEMAAPENVLPAEDPDAWAMRLRALWRDEQGRRSCGEAALKLAREKFSEDRAYEGLLAAYTR
ncbi:MAG TPA: glycosyltransferase family 4 protein [Solirubrobacteraceae bacterium]|nr:glycosyltransferase family 4 protein [Solirubrobacteraceae bacterium]